MKKDRIVGLVIVLIGVCVSLFSTQIPVNPNITDPGSRLFPLIGSIGMIIFGLGIFFTAKETEEKPVITKEGWKRLIKISIVFILYTVALKFLGFIVSTPVFLYLMVSMLSYEKRISIWKKGLFSLIVSVCIWIVFVELLSVMLPKGILM